MNIIIVDDNTDFLESLSYYITYKLGHNVIATFTDGKYFLDHHLELTADLVLMDISMPLLDGYATAKFLNWEFYNLKIIAITMFTNKAYLEQLIKVGFKGCVFKSEIYTDLPKAITEVMNDRFYWPEKLQ